MRAGPYRCTRLNKGIVVNSTPAGCAEQERRFARSYIAGFWGQPLWLHQAKEVYINRFFGKTGRGVAVAAAMLAAIGLAAAPRPAHALSPAAGVGIGIGAFAAGSVLANPY